MEYGLSSSSTWDYYTLINELTQGMEQAKQLKLYLNSASTETQDLLLQRIQSSYEKALLILKWNGSSAQQYGGLQQAPESSVSVDGSPRNEDTNNNNNIREYQELRDASKKRKTQPTWSEQIRVNSENGLEGPSDDCYSWRKYGQKDILGAKYPRSYYRCTYRHLRNCWATKQVQRSDEDPTVFDITHKGMHTCNLSASNNNSSTQPRPMTPEKQEMKHIYNQNTSVQSHQSNGTLMSFRSGLRVDTGDSETKDAVSVSASLFSFPPAYTQMDGENHQIFPISTTVEDNILGTYSPSFVSPATSGSNYFSLSPCQMIHLGTKHQSSDSDLTEIISATASATNSPIAGLDFSMESIELDPNFQFNASGFFN